MNQPKRHKFQNDENSPYKAYLEKSRVVARSEVSAVRFGENAESIPVASGSSSLTPEVKRLCFARSQSESALTPCSIIKAVERSKSAVLSQ